MSFQISLGSWVPETWTTSDKLYGAILCFCSCFFFNVLKQFPSHCSCLGKCCNVVPLITKVTKLVQKWVAEMSSNLRDTCKQTITNMDTVIMLCLCIKELEKQGFTVGHQRVGDDCTISAAITSASTRWTWECRRELLWACPIALFETQRFTNLSFFL